MSLKTKLYVGFIVMIALVAIISVMAIVSFRIIGDNADTTDVLVDENTTLYTPANSQFNRLSSSIIEAGNKFASYIFTYLDSEITAGDAALEEAKLAVKELQDILAKAPPDKMPVTRQTLPLVGERITKLDEITDTLHATTNAILKKFNEVFELEKKVSVSLVNACDAARERVIGLLDTDLSDKDKLKEDMTRRVYRIQILEGIIRGMGEVKAEFWRMQGLYDHESDLAYENAVKHLNTCVETIKTYSTAANIIDPNIRESFNAMQADMEAYLAKLREIGQISDDLTKLGEDTNTLYNEVNAATITCTTATEKIVFNGMSDVAAGMDKIDSTLTRYTLTISIASIAALVIGLVLATGLIRNITIPINRIIETLASGSKQINAAASQIASSAQNLAEGATEQAASLEETSSALEQMASMTRQNADNSTKTNDTTVANNRLIEQGADAMRQMSEAMADINDKSEKVGRIVKTIEDIAFQTNLLALNAAVEAARAGEAGKGFAVVADEVRNLSQRSAQAAKDTTDLINGTVESVKHGGGIASRLTESFTQIEEGSHKVGQLINEITSATNEQAQGVDQVNTAVAQMDKVTQQNAASSEETASAAEELNAQAVSLGEAISDLVGLISGVKEQRAAEERSQAPAAAPARIAHAPQKRLAAPAAAGTPRVAKVNSSDVIPLEKGFDEF